MPDDAARTYTEEGAKPECWEGEPTRLAICECCGEIIQERDSRKWLKARVAELEEALRGIVDHIGIEWDRCHSCERTVIAVEAALSQARQEGGED